MANVANLQYNSPYVNAAGVTISLPNAGARVRLPLMNPFYVTPNSFFPSGARPTMGQIWPRGIGLTIVTPMSTTLGVQAYPSSDGTIVDQVESVISFNAVVIDDDSFWDVSEPTKLVIQESGWHAVIAQATIVPTGAGLFRVGIKLNGSTLRGQQYNFLAAEQTTASVGALLKLEAGDYIELAVFANLGGSSNQTIKGGQNLTYLQLTRTP